jgi:hypothetical protein
MTSIILGKTLAGEEISYNYIPYESKAILVQGITGSRKTSLILELAKRFAKAEPRPQIVIISREGEEAKLRDVIPFVLVGQEGEIPIDEGLAHELGENVRKQHADVIIDIISLKTEKQQDEFISQFIDGILLDGQQKFWKPCVVIIDEVQIFANSSRGSKSRDAITRMVQVCRKRGIVPIFASHKMKDFYHGSRDECGNSIIGYLRNPRDRSFACELLNLSGSGADAISDFQNEPRGRFYAEGSDITHPAKIFVLDSVKYPQDDKFAIPRLSLGGLQKADALRESFDVTNKMSLETQLRFDNARLQSLVDRLSLTQMSQENIQRICKEAKDEGWNEAIQHAYHIMLNNEDRNLFGIRKSHQVQLVKKSDGRRTLILH